MDGDELAAAFPRRRLTEDEVREFERRKAERMAAMPPVERLRYCDSYQRMPTLLELWDSGTVTAARWLRLLGEAWTVCDNIGCHVDELLETPIADALWGPVSIKRRMMTTLERRAFDALPEQVRIYRGCYLVNRRGLSWSLDRKTAARFPTIARYRRPGEAPQVICALVQKRDIAAVKLDRNEQEVIADPHPDEIVSIRYLGRSDP